MRFARSAPLLSAVLLSTALATPGFAQPPAVVNTGDEQTLKKAGLAVDAVSLLDFFKKRTPGTVAQEQIATLVKQLSDKDTAIRDKAAADLVSLGSVAVPALRHAANDFDNPDAATRARTCLQNGEGGNGGTLVSSAARLLAQTNPPNSAQVLLGYAPFAEDDAVLEEISKALASVATRDGKLDPALTQALKDDVPVRRALAGEVLSKSPLGDARNAVRYLLNDAKPSVRLRAALALADARDAEAITVLINLLGELPQTQSRQVEDFLTQLAGEWNVSTPQSNDEIARKMRRDVWNAWWQATEGSVVLDELKKRSLDDASREKAEALIVQLGDDQQTVRDKAMTELLGLGSIVRPLVRRAATGANAKIAPHAQKCLQLLVEKGASNPLASAAPRLLAVRKPAGAVEALMAFLPFAEDDTLQGEVQSALVYLAVREGKTDPALVKALDDKLPLRRAIAAEVIAQTALDDNRAALEKLLADPDLVTVRSRAAQALASAGDKKALPVLIALLADLPMNQALQVEEYLRFVAREQSPETTLGDENVKAEKVREVWTAWWQARPADFILPRMENLNRLLGYTFLVEQYNPNKGTGRVIELDATGKVRWTIEGLQGPIDAQVLPGDKVLIVEQNTSRVSERDVKGKIIWDRSFPNQPVSARRLPNGNTFIALRNQLIELDRAGKEVFTYNRPNHDVMAAAKMRDGSVCIMTYQWQYIRVDANGKELKNQRLGAFTFQVNSPGIDFLPNDRVLVANYQQGKVQEMDLSGKVVWEASVQGAQGVHRLPNGNTLACSQNLGKAVELDRSGKVVWECKETIRPASVRRR